MTTFTKDPDATLRYTFDWADWLETGEVISTVDWEAESGLTDASPTNDDTTASVLISGGTAGETYTLRCRVTTTGGQIDDRTVNIEVSEQ